MLEQGFVLNNRYRIVKLLGQGGFGAVYRAWDLNLQIPVAVKENFETTPDSARQFAREANMLAGLRHPNLPKVTDHFTIPDLGQYLAMEYIEGNDLIEKLEASSGPLPETQVLDWANQILNALEYLHKQTPPIIHRDIKPENIRITLQGQAVLVDFGIAKLSDGSKKTTIGARAVTPGYSPHEQYGQGATDVRSDIYSLGATVYMLLTGKTPPESISRMVTDPLVPPRSFNPAVSANTERAVLKALAMDPEKRWQSASEFRTALSTPVANMYVMQNPSRGVEAVYSGALPSRKGKTAIPWVATTIVGLLVLAVCGVGAWLGLQYLRDQTANTGGPPAAMSPTETQTIAIPPAVPATDVSNPISTGGRIKIGLLAPLTGQVPTFGVSTQEGVELAVKEWNAKGGVLGRQIELVVGDSQCSADPAVNAANQLIDQDGVKYLVGEVCSSASIPISEIVNQKKVVQISPTSTNLAVTVDKDGKVKPFTFRACFIDPFQGLVMAKFAQDKGYKTAFIMYNQGNDYVRGLAEAFEKAFTEIGGQIIGKEAYLSTETDYSAILDQVKASNAEILYLPDYYNIANLIAAQAKERGINAVMMGGDGWDSIDLDITALDGSYYSNHYDPGDTRPVVMEWLKKYGAEYKNDKGEPKVPDALAALGYDAANLLIAAIEKAGVDDSTRVAEALAGLTWEGVSGTIRFDSLHNPIKNAVIMAVEDGRKYFYTSILP